MSLDKFLNNRSRCEIVLGRRIRTNEPRKEKNIIRRKLRKTLRRSKITQSSLFNRGRWALNCGEMTFLREFCSPLYFLGQMLSLSILKNPKFGNRHMNGQATLHFFISYVLQRIGNRHSEQKMVLSVHLLLVKSVLLALIAYRCISQPHQRLLFC